MLRHMILGLLRGGDRIHGYALWKAYERRSGRLIQNGKFYRALKILAETNLIRPMAAPDSDPRRTPYEITAAGRIAFDQWVTAFDEAEQTAEDEISARALFVFELPRPVATEFFVSLEDVLSRRWKRLEYERERVLSQPGMDERDRSAQSLLLARGLERASADLTWLREVGAIYKQLHPEPAHAATPSTTRGRTTGRAHR